VSSEESVDDGRDMSGESGMSAEIVEESI